MDIIKICNMALGHVATRTSIASLDEGSAEADQCVLFYEISRDYALQKARWNFARKQIPLALLRSVANGDSVMLPWRYQYVYPTDCIQARFIVPTYQNPAGESVGYVGPPIKFLVSSDVDGNGNPINTILTNQDGAILVYTYRCTDPNLYDAQFVDTLSYILGSKLAMPLTGDAAKRDSLAQAAAGLLRDAAVSSGNEGLATQNTTPDWLRVRGISSDYAYPDYGMQPSDPNQLFLIP